MEDYSFGGDRNKLSADASEMKPSVEKKSECDETKEVKHFVSVFSTSNHDDIISNMKLIVGTLDDDLAKEGLLEYIDQLEASFGKILDEKNALRGVNAIARDQFMVFSKKFFAMPDPAENSFRNSLVPSTVHTVSSVHSTEIDRVGPYKGLVLPGSCSYQLPPVPSGRIGSAHSTQSAPGFMVCNPYNAQLSGTSDQSKGTVSSIPSSLFASSSAGSSASEEECLTTSQQNQSPTKDHPSVELTLHDKISSTHDKANELFTAEEFLLGYT